MPVPPNPVVPIPTPPDYDPTEDALSYARLLWNHINRRLVGLLSNHHANHEPGGMDALIFPLGGLVDVSLGTAGITNGAALVYDAAGTHWQAGTASAGGGGNGQAFFEMVGTALSTGSVPGPTNLTGGALTITKVRIAANGECSGIAAGESFSFGAGGGTDLNEDLSRTWNDGGYISATISTIGTATTYVTVDVYFTG